MCGLVGVIGDMTNADKRAFDFMIGIDSCRGRDSAGVARAPALMKNRSNVEIVKEVGTGYDLQWVPEYYNNKKDREISGDWAFLMGHNRWATVGKVTVKNAHPFKCGNIIGAQNGTLPEYWRKKLFEYEKFETDTEALFHNINLFGAEEVIPKLDGAWALTWYDKSDDTFHILRNDERPLCFAWKDNGKVLYYASEPWMIYAAADKYKIKLENDTVYWVSEDTHYVWKLESMSSFSRKRQSSSILKGGKAAPVHHVDYSKYHGGSYTSSSSTSSVQTGANSNLSDKRGDTTPINLFNHATAKDDDPMQKPTYWLAKIGTYKEFVVSPMICTDEQRKQYIKGFTVDGRIEIRFYPSTTVDTEAILGDKDVQTFACKIKRVKLKNNGKSFYLLPDSDTIMVATYKGNAYRKADAPIDVKIDDEIPWKDGNILYPDSDLFSIGGVPVSEKEWIDRTSCGCAWCSSVPTPDKAGAITWLRGNNDFLCEDCSDNPDVRMYVNLYNQ